MKNAAFLIDGFNLYHSIDKNFGDSKYKWLNLRSLAEKIVGSESNVSRVFYFTAYAYWDKEKVNRHKMYVRALSAHKTEIILGKFKGVTKKVIRKKMINEVEFPDYNFPDEFEYKTYEEKRTDVNIAVKILELAMSEKYDEIYIVSGDSDFVPAINFVKQKFKNIKFINVLPVNSYGKDLGIVCHSQVKLTQVDLEESLFSEEITIGEEILFRPDIWK
jgi:uncharacterized LabA/DUF88 family protein